MKNLYLKPIARRNNMQNEWQSISTLPDDYKGMFVVIGLDVLIPRVNKQYTTDPYCVWLNRNPLLKIQEVLAEKFVRWPHPFPPTHWLPLPPTTSPTDTVVEEEK